MFNILFCAAWMLISLCTMVWGVVLNYHRSIGLGFYLTIGFAILLWADHLIDSIKEYKWRSRK